MGSCMSSPEGPSHTTSAGGTVYAHPSSSSKHRSDSNGHANGSASPHGSKMNGGMGNGNGSSKKGGLNGDGQLADNGQGGNGAGGPPMMENKKAQRERSYAIDKQIEEDSKKYRKECKILLLGEFTSERSEASDLTNERA